MTKAWATLRSSGTVAAKLPRPTVPRFASSTADFGWRPRVRSRSVERAQPAHLARVMRFTDWLESRTGYRGILERILDEPVRGGARWVFVFGSVITFLLVLQALTGVLLAAYYAPSTTTA